MKTQERAQTPHIDCLSS